MNTIQTLIVFGIVAISGVGVTSVYAGNPNTDDASRWGQFTSGAATTNGQEFGEHASSPPPVPIDLPPDRDTGRAGIGNINQILDPLGTKHPSELAESLCGSSTFPCP